MRLLQNMTYHKYADKEHLILKNNFHYYARPQISPRQITMILDAQAKTPLAEPDVFNEKRSPQVD